MNRPNLVDILTNQHYYNLFDKFLRKVHAAESLEFYIEVELFKRITEPEKLAKETFRMFNKFIINNSSYEINVEGEIKTRIRNILQNDSCWDNSLYNDAQVSVYNLLQADCLPMFYKSEYWTSYKSMSHFIHYQLVMR